jgi:hypothetical protein
MSQRENILDNIVTTLKGIKTSAGYNNTVGLVTREPNDWNRLQPNQKPAIIVTWSSDEKDTETITASGQYVISSLNVVIRGIVYAKTDIEGKLNDFAEDIEKILAVDEYRGTYANYTIPRVITVYQGEDSYNIVFDFEFLVGYHYVYGSP